VYLTHTINEAQAKCFLCCSVYFTVNVNYTEHIVKYLCLRNSGMRENTLRHLLEKANISPTEAAKRIGVSRTSVYSWFMSEPEITLTNCIKIAKILKVSLRAVAESVGHDLDGIPDDCEGGNDEN
jgi:DNA-binding XRE family transcriptional regulator